jgi:uncharacterized RDD family membrane protein YckC
LSVSREPEWDELSIETPELVGIDMHLAGIGSRFVALLVDYLIWLATVAVLILAVSVVDPSLAHFSRLGRKWANALFLLIPFLLYWGYFTLFEAFWSGRTPGKRLARIRVIQRSGRGIGLFESMTRNLLRVVDQFPVVYGVGVVTIFLTRQHQRLGDLAAGTLVVHERENLAAPSTGASARTLTAGIFDRVADEAGNRAGNRLGFRPGGDGWNWAGAVELGMPAAKLQLLGVADLEVLEGFFARRLDFTMEKRIELAQRIAAAIGAKTGLEPPPGMSTETYLEEIARQLRDLARMR